MQDSLVAQLEALLFVASRPLSVRKIAEVLQANEADVERAAEELRHSYHEGNRGIQLLRQGATIQLMSHPRYAAIVTQLYRDELTGELTKPALETLTIIAYRGPIRRWELDQIRGVNCSLIVRNLLLRGLIETDESQSQQERSYQISIDFLRHLGIERVQDLPEYHELHQNETITQVLHQEAPSAGV